MNRRAMRVMVATAARRTVSERGALAVSFGFYVVVVSVLSGLWRSAAGAHGGAIAGYSAAALTWYAAATEASTLSLVARMIDDIGTDIASGAVASELLRPASVVGARVLTEIGRALPRMAVLGGTGIVLATWLGGPAPDGRALALAAPSLVLAGACNIAAQHAFAGAAFWLRNAGSAWYLYQKLVFLVGGMLIPFEVLPGWLHRIASVLPFKAMAYAPGRLASGHFEPGLLVQQALWLVVLVIAAAAVFRAGERRLQVVGG